VLGLRVKTPGEYRLTISGQTPLGPTPEQSVDFQVAFPFLGALIDWPGPNEPITDYKDDFTAYGPLSPDQLGPATLKDEDCVSVMLLSSSSDPVELKMWTASFASLDTGVYTLHVEDTQGHGDTSDGLSVA
jgi:hypothetical protein